MSRAAGATSRQTASQGECWLQEKKLTGRAEAGPKPGFRWLASLVGELSGLAFSKGRMDGWMDGWTDDGQMGGLVDAQMIECTQTETTSYSY